MSREWSIRRLEPREQNALTKHGAAVFRVNYGILIVGDVSAHYQDERMKACGEEPWLYVVDTRLHIGVEICHHVSELWSILTLKAQAIPSDEFKAMMEEEIENAVLLATLGPFEFMRAIARRSEANADREG